MPLDTLANVKASLFITGTTDDAVLNRLIDAADAFISNTFARIDEESKAERPESKVILVD